MATNLRILLAGVGAEAVAEIGEYLVQGDYDVRAAEDHSLALDLLRSFQPHLVLIGVFHGPFAAFEFCQHAKQDFNAKVLMMTPLNDHLRIQRAAESGADDFLTIPLNREELQMRIKVLCGLSNVV